ncbi:uncharacterized protein SEPMUDRAFT_149695 [Sphaerulina musiva SO2202]|uniref:Uncharacterized protein n=1 Tax=Sphaerulina musiva (strain SO2202) TaxID=692275 RepID=N1QF45_SPHMS|nr:uncharacterized protein SEPMUDRAFT_149695 [Sphaerulina musiva SO2202]EMF11833.1 hypothetical protein SEPMUDRAFT_149695 [Sphaerulina musiva SO2202]
MEHENAMREREREALHMDEMRRREAYYSRGPPMQTPQPMQAYGGTPFGSGRQPMGSMNLRDISRNETEAAMQEQRHREQMEHERRHFGEQQPPFPRERDAPMLDRYGQRAPPDDRQTPLLRRPTPQSGGFPGGGFPPPSGRR